MTSEDAPDTFTTSGTVGEAFDAGNVIAPFGAVGIVAAIGVTERPAKTAENVMA